MSAGAATGAPREVARPSRRTQILAVLVLIALAAVAAYTVFAPPTRVPVNSGARTAPARTSPATTPVEPEGGEGGGEQGD